jgi:hypothetical protein
MTEEIKILLSTDIDSKGLDQFRKLMNDSRNEMNAMARTIQKGSTEWKYLKASVADVNKIIKMSDSDLRKHIDSVNAETLAMEKSNTTAKTLTGSKNSLRTATGNLGQGIAQTSRAFGSILGASVSLIGTMGTLTPLIGEQGGKFDETTQKIQTYSFALVGVGQAISNLKYLVPVLTGLFTAANVVTGALGASVLALSGAFAVVKETIANLNISEGLGNLIMLREELRQLGRDTDQRAKDDLISRQEAFIKENGFVKKNYTLGDKDFAPGSLEGKNTFNQEMMKLDAKISKGSQVNEVKTKEVELTNELIDAQKELARLELVRDTTFTEEQKTTVAYYNLLGKIKTLAEQISNLSIAPIEHLANLMESVKGANLDIIVKDAYRGGADERPNQRAGRAEETDGRNIYEDVTNTYGAINNMMSVLNLGTETFVSKLLGGFNSVLIIMESIKAVNSILSFIPGFASGGAFSGGPMIVGERGPELLFANTSGYVMNNQDSQRYLNSSVNNSQPAINLYVGANLSPKYFTAQLEKANSRKNYRKV